MDCRDTLAQATAATAASTVADQSWFLLRSAAIKRGAVSGGTNGESRRNTHTVCVLVSPYLRVESAVLQGLSYVHTLGSISETNCTESVKH